MQKKIKMLTVVPENLARELAEKKRIKDYNTLPQLNKLVLQMIREYMIQKIGYPNLPMACLSNFKGLGQLDGEDILAIIPVNAKDSVLFQLEMPTDMIVSTSFSALLSLSNEANDISPDDKLEVGFLNDQLEEILYLGYDETVEDQISFIPFLAVDRCKFYAKFDSNFKTEELNLAGLTETRIKELASFMN